MPDVGDSTTPTLTVTPFGASTAATITIYKPDGTTTSPAASTADSGATWTTAAYTYATAGWYVFIWTVTGTGAGVEQQRVFVGPVDDLPPDIEPIYVSLEEFKESVKITDATRDELILKRIRAASRQIDDKTGRRFWLDTTATARTYTPRGRTVRTDDGELLLIDDLGVAPTAVEYGSGSTYTALASTAYLLGPDNALAQGQAITGVIRTSSTWPAGSGYRVRITGRWGWPRIPEPIEQATLILATRLFKRKDSPEGVMGSADFGFIRMGRTDPDVQALIDPYILPGIA